MLLMHYNGIINFMISSCFETPLIVVNPAGGNEPAILGALLAGGVSDSLIHVRPDTDGCRAIVPVVGRQAAILADEFKGNPRALKSVLVDPAAGEILSPILTTQGDFARHIRVLASQKPRIDTAISQHYASTEPLELHDLSGNPVTVNANDIVGVLDTGGRAEIRPELPHHFAFPVLLSQLARKAIEDKLPFDESDLGSVERVMARMEAEYVTAYLPLVNTLAGSALHGLQSDAPIDEHFEHLLGQQKTDNTVLTPPLKQPMSPQIIPDITRNSVYAMLSGTGSAIDEVQAATETLVKEGALDVYTNPWSNNIAGARKLSPTALLDPRILTVVSRSGWGTGWQMLNMAKPWLLVPEQPGDDPEIHYNNELITSLGIGEVVDTAHFNASHIVSAIAKYTPRIQALRSLTQDHFKMPGPAFVGEDIAKFYLQSGRLR